jgi:hypothetical protein
MQVTVELSAAVIRELEIRARREGATLADLIRCLVEAHVEDSSAPAVRNLEAHLPLIAASETGPIHPVTGEAVFGSTSRTCNETVPASGSAC